MTMIVITSGDARMEWDIPAVPDQVEQYKDWLDARGEEARLAVHGLFADIHSAHVKHLLDILKGLTSSRHGTGP